MKPKDLAAGLKSSVTIPCKASGIPSVSYEWFYNGDLIGSSSRYSFTGGNLTITGLGKAQSGMYQCVARNKHGELISGMELRLQGVQGKFIFLVLLYVKGANGNLFSLLFTVI